MATLVATPTPSIEDMLQRAQALLPGLRARAAETEALGRLPDRTVEDVRAGGFFRVLQPRRFGGLELDYGRLQTELCSVLGQACGSSAWVQMVVACHAWCLSMFEDAAQQAVWREFSLDISFGASGASTPGSTVNPNPMYGLPLAGFFYFNVTTEALGIARGAIDAFAEQLAERGDRPNLFGRQIRLAESSAELDAAEALVRSDVEVIDRILHHGAAIPRTFQAKLGRDLSFMVKLCTQAVDRLTTAVGANGMSGDNPVHRAARDLHAIANHAVNNWEMQAAQYSRARTGLPPLTMS